MNGNGIMQDIRELISQGLTAPEIIGQGYAPSTVYRVQRDTRRKLEFLGNCRHGSATTSRGLGYLTQLEQENRQLHRQMETLEVQLANVGLLGDRVEELRRRLEEATTRQEQLLRELAAFKTWVGKVNGELDDLAQVFKDDVLLGIGEPRWRRRR